MSELKHVGKAKAEHDRVHCRPVWCGEFPPEGHPLAATPEDRELLARGANPYLVYAGAYDHRAVRLPEMPLPPGPPPDEEPTINLRVVALQAAMRTVQAAPGDPASKTYREVLLAAKEYLTWLEDER